ncbi:collagen alpha-1(I) chain-like [Cervus elaphus]|uniref:collagen alpha-1(I) chain-like n=1 Tax=Cervus elaphus TaxID=9860 RepID=UPI001CC2BB82|nr:collagen alpha-1(I) chain-like [Cervus elaphus]
MLRFLSARPISKGHSVTRSPVVSGPDGDPGPENPGPATAGTTRFCLGDLTGCWVPGSHGQAASPLRGLALWPGVLCVLGLPGPTDGAQPGPPPTPGWKQEQPLRGRPPSTHLDGSCPYPSHSPGQGPKETTARGQGAEGTGAATAADRQTRVRLTLRGPRSSRARACFEDMGPSGLYSRVVAGHSAPASDSRSLYRPPGLFLAGCRLSPGPQPVHSSAFKTYAPAPPRTPTHLGAGSSPLPAGHGLLGLSRAPRPACSGHLPWVIPASSSPHQPPRAPGGGAGPALPLRILRADAQPEQEPRTVTDQSDGLSCLDFLGFQSSALLSWWRGLFDHSRSPRPLQTRGHVAGEPQEAAAESGPRVGEPDVVTEEGDVVGTEGLTFELGMEGVRGLQQEGRRSRRSQQRGAAAQVVGAGAPGVQEEELTQRGGVTKDKVLVRKAEVSPSQAHEAPITDADPADSSPSVPALWGALVWARQPLSPQTALDLTWPHHLPAFRCPQAPLPAGVLQPARRIAEPLPGEGRGCPHQPLSATLALAAAHHEGVSKDSPKPAATLAGSTSVHQQPLSCSRRCLSCPESQPRPCGPPLASESWGPRPADSKPPSEGSNPSLSLRFWTPGTEKAPPRGAADPQPQECAFTEPGAGTQGARCPRSPARQRLSEGSPTCPACGPPGEPTAPRHLARPAPAGTDRARLHSCGGLAGPGPGVGAGMLTRVCPRVPEPSTADLGQRGQRLCARGPERTASASVAGPPPQHSQHQPRLPGHEGPRSSQ